MGFWGYPKGSASELLDGTLKLRHKTTLFTTRFPSWSLPRVVNGAGKRQFVTPGHQPDEGSNAGKRHLLMSFRIQGIQRRGDGKDCAPLPQ